MPKRVTIMLLKVSISLCYLLCCCNLFSQIKVQNHFFENQAFSNISVDEDGIWAISGDSAFVFRFDFASKKLLPYTQFNGITKKRFTGILSKGASGVMVATAGDFLFYLNQGTITKLGKANGILNGNINSIFGDLNNTTIGTDSLGYKANIDNMFSAFGKDNYSEKKTIILADKGNTWDCPFAQKATYEDRNCHIQYSDNYSHYSNYFNLDLDETPGSIALMDGYLEFFLATNKGLRYYKQYVGLGYSSIMELETPTTSLYRFLNENYQFGYMLIGSNTCLSIMNLSPTHIITKILANIQINAIRSINKRNIWIATNKGIVEITTPLLFSPSVDQNLCISEPITFQNTLPIKGDSIHWYRNDTLIISSPNPSISIVKGGVYYAIVSNPLVESVDTIAKITFKTNFIDYVLSFSGNNTDLCIGSTKGLYVNPNNAEKFYWIKDGLKFADQINYVSINEPGIYSVLITNCNHIDIESNKIEIKLINPPSLAVNFPKDTSICVRETLNVNVITNGDDYYVTGPNDFRTWSKTLQLTQEGSYSFYSGFSNIFNCLTSKTLNLKLNSLPYAWVEKKGNNLTASSIIKNADGQEKLSFNLKNYAWYYNDIPVKGATDSILNNAGAGYYKVKVTDFNGCSNFSNTYTNLSLNIEDPIAEGLQIYPNPTRGNFNITTTSSVHVSGINIYNNEGQRVKSIPNNLLLPYSCDISDLPNGLYIIQIQNNPSHLFRIVLQK